MSKKRNKNVPSPLFVAVLMLLSILVCIALASKWGAQVGDARRKAAADKTEWDAIHAIPFHRKIVLEGVPPIGFEGYAKLRATYRSRWHPWCREIVDTIAYEYRNDYNSVTYVDSPGVVHFYVMVKKVVGNWALVYMLVNSGDPGDAYLHRSSSGRWTLVAAGTVFGDIAENGWNVCGYHMPKAVRE